MPPGHWWCCAHPLSNRRRGLQGHQQGLRRPGRNSNTAAELLTIQRLDPHQQGQIPVHGILQTQAHGALLRPVPTALRRGQRQTWLGGRTESHAAKNLTLTIGLSLQVRQHSIFQDDLNTIERPNKIE